MGEVQVRVEIAGGDAVGEAAAAEIDAHLAAEIILLVAEINLAGHTETGEGAAVRPLLDLAERLRPDPAAWAGRRGGLAQLAHMAGPGVARLQPQVADRLAEDRGAVHADARGADQIIGEAVRVVDDA